MLMTSYDFLHATMGPWADTNHSTNLVIFRWVSMLEHHVVQAGTIRIIAAVAVQTVSWPHIVSRYGHKCSAILQIVRDFPAWRKVCRSLGRGGGRATCTPYESKTRAPLW